MHFQLLWARQTTAPEHQHTHTLIHTHTHSARTMNNCQTFLQRVRQKNIQLSDHSDRVRFSQAYFNGFSSEQYLHIMRSSEIYTERGKERETQQHEETSTLRSFCFVVQFLRNRRNETCLIECDFLPRRFFQSFRCPPPPHTHSLHPQHFEQPSIFVFIFSDIFFHDVCICRLFYMILSLHRFVVKQSH